MKHTEGAAERQNNLDVLWLGKGSSLFFWPPWAVLCLPLADFPSQDPGCSWPHPKIPTARKVPWCHLPPARLHHAPGDGRRCPGGIYNSKSLFLLVMLPSPSWHAHRPVAMRGLTRSGDGESDAGVAATTGVLRRDSWPCPLPAARPPGEGLGLETARLFSAKTLLRRSSSPKGAEIHAFSPKICTEGQ